MKVLITGGLGYIGSHITVELLEKGHSVIIVDNLSKSKVDVFLKIKKIIDNQNICFYEIDIRNTISLDKLFRQVSVDLVIHCAGLKVISESLEKPFPYYDNNLIGTFSLCHSMEKAGVKNLIFSSSASVYNFKNKLPIKENDELLPNNVYGRTKLYTEFFLNDLKSSNKGWNIFVLRYFNPVSAHYSAEIGEIPNGIPSNLLPYLSLVALGKIKFVSVYGNNYDTHDGTGVRDFIHVVDLAKGHVKAMEKMMTNLKVRNLIEFINLGTGTGYSVLEIIRSFQKITKKEIPFKIKPRRHGDIAASYADINYAKSFLSWQAKLDLDKICYDQWNFMLNHKNLF